MAHMVSSWPSLEMTGKSAVAQGFPIKTSMASQISRYSQWDSGLQMFQTEAGYWGRSDG